LEVCGRGVDKFVRTKNWEVYNFVRTQTLALDGLETQNQKEFEFKQNKS
jgi:hypothetical protein